MTRLENVIEEVKNARTGENRPWIFDENGNIKNNVLCCEVLDILEELEEYEISVSDEWIKDFACREDIKGDNTYNYNANISNDLNYDYKETADGAIMLIKVHLYGDIRGSYSDYFAVKFDGLYEFYELESTMQHKDIGNGMVADLNAFSELYNVYDYENGEDVGEFYEIEIEDLLNEINNK